MSLQSQRIVHEEDQSECKNTDYYTDYYADKPIPCRFPHFQINYETGELKESKYDKYIQYHTCFSITSINSLFYFIWVRKTILCHLSSYYAFRSESGLLDMQVSQQESVHDLNLFHRTEYLFMQQIFLAICYVLSTHKNTEVSVCLQSLSCV